MNIDNLCMNCMSDLNGEMQCSNCGYNVDSPQFSPNLPLKTVIGNKYIIGCVISSNSEGSLYMSYDMEREIAVLIREFYPERFCERQEDGVQVLVADENKDEYYDYLSQFKALWTNLAMMRGYSAHIPVLDILEENNTVYAISEYVESISLREFLLRSKTGYLNWEKANQLFMPVLTFLSALHKKGIIHCGISPETLMIGRDGKLRLGGFSISQCRLAGTVYNPEFFDGYTPIEQYGQELDVGCRSDVYAFCAVLYRALVGSVPQDAIARSKNDQLIIPARYAEMIPAYVINALMNGLQIDPAERTNDIETLRDELSATPSSVISGISGVNIHSEESKKPEVVYVEEDTPGSTALKTFIIILIVGLLAFGGWMAYEYISERKAETPVEESTTLSNPVEVPDFTNWPYKEIVSNPVQNKRFTIKVKYDYSSTIEKDRIISQSLTPGKTVEQGTELTLVVSKGPEYVVVPSVIGLTEEIAKTQLESAGFVVVVEKKPNLGNNEAGTVAEISPEEGTSHIKGTTVTLYIWDEIDFDFPTDNLLGGGFFEELFGNYFR
ncbi:MAG: PASTA domain-containing protein [Clostridia bacterium]|nr:PASTA domain-containing protein [Clostridia bacterium]